MSRSCLALALVLMLLAAAVPATAQDVGSAAQGARLAAEVCAACHATGAGDFTSPDPDAPPFSAVAEDPAIGRTALLVWFRSPHPSMPMLRLSATEEHDLIAYFLSLKE